MRRLADERGIALVMALGILVVLSITTIALLTYTGSNGRTARYQNARVSAYSLAEAGVAEAVSVLNLPTNNALVATTLPNVADPRTSPFTGGHATWYGSLDLPNSRWIVTSTGTVNNPSGAAPVTRTLTVRVPIVPTLSQAANNQAWNYIYSYKANDGDPDTCEMTIRQSVQVSTPLFVEGDLCIEQTAGVRQGSHGTTLVVKGRLTLANSNQNKVGLTTARISEAYIGNGCKLQSNPVHSSPCSDADNVFASQYDTAQPNLGDPPVVHWDDWYNGAAPGPKFPCVPENS